MKIKKEKHSPEMKKVIKDYNNSVDISLCNFIKDVRDGKDTIPLTVGFVSEEMAIEIFNLTGLSVEGNRIVIGADDIRHILNRHGKEGKADNSMANDKDIARLSYVLSNYDSIEWNGETSNLYYTKDGKNAPKIVIKKRIDGTYYVIEVVSDSKQKRNVVCTIYLKKATN